MFTSIVAAAALQFQPLLSFRRSPSFDQPISVEIGLLKTEGRAAYWFKKTAIEGDKTSVWWTDTERCPAARSALRKIRNLQMPRVNVPFLDDNEIRATADGVIYELWGNANYRSGSAYEFKLASNTGTPLADWVDESLETLSHCWSKEEPYNHI